MKNGLGLVLLRTLIGRVWWLPVLFLLATAVIVKADDFTYTTNFDNTINIIGYTGSGGVVVIPSTIAGKTVTSLGDCAFRSCPSLVSVTIPASVTSMGNWPFIYCYSLTAITVDPANASYSSMDGVLFDKSQTTLIQYPGGKSGSYTIPSSVTSLGDYAFRSCPSLVSVTIPASVTSIGILAIGEFCTSLTAITVDAANAYYSSVDGVLFNKSQATLIQYPGGKSGSYTIPASVTSIGYGAFGWCPVLTSVTIPASVVSIGYSAFNACTSLTNVTVPASVTSIGDEAFAQCHSLTAITVDAANAYYSSLDGVLFNKSQTTLIQYPGGKSGSYTIPASVTSIGYEAFWPNGSLTSVTVPASVTSIGDAAFSYTLLASVYFEGNAPTVGLNVFAGSDNVTVYRLDGATGWPTVPDSWAGRPTALWSSLAGILQCIPAGNFTMGDTFGEGNSCELPAHSVYVGAFYMDKYEVTKAFWDSIYSWAITNGYGFGISGFCKDTNHPVEAVNWYNCAKWCNARSEKEGLSPCYYTSGAKTTVYRTGDLDITNECVKWAANGYRLPTEAEWEKAARGGSSGHRFPWNDVDTIAHGRANYFSTNEFLYDVSSTRGYHPSYTNGAMPYTSPVGSFTTNGYGIYDIAGNIMEWCWDWYADGYYSSSPTADPHGPSTGSFRVLRGGDWGWGYGAFKLRCAYREHAYLPVSSCNSFGFRCVRGNGAETNFTISGAVYYSTNPLPNYSVYVEKSNQVYLMRTSDANGHYIFSPVENGEYVVWCDSSPEYPGSRGWSTTINGQSVTLDVYATKSITPIYPTNNSIVDMASPLFSWQAPQEAKQYDFQLNVVSNWYLADLKRGLTNSYYQTDRILTNNTIYQWLLDAYDAFGNPIAYFMLQPQFTLYATLYPPSGVSASDGAYTDKVRVTWNVASRATGYEVWRGLTNATSSASRLADSTGTGYDDTSATADVLYYYWVKAKNATQTSDFSSPDSGFRTSSPTTLSAPAGVSASDGAYTDKVRVTWNAASRATGYEVWRGLTNATFGATKIGDTTGTNYDDMSVSAGKTYYYWLKARNLAATSPFSLSDVGYCAVPGGAGSADLAATSLLFDPAVIATNAHPTLVMIVLANKGPDAMTDARVSYDFYLSNNDTFSDGDDKWIGDYQIDSSIAANSYGTAIVSDTGLGGITIPATAAGMYYVFAKARHASFLSDPDMSNNEAMRSGPIMVGTGGENGSGIKTAVGGDFDGDRIADPAVYEEASGTWQVKLSSKGYGVASLPGFGGSGYVVVKGDFDGDGKTDPAIYRESTGDWSIRFSGRDYALGTINMGGLGYQAVEGDFNGGGKSDLMVYRDATKYWLYILTETESAGMRNFGAVGYHPVAGDYDGDRITDYAVYRETTGDWLVLLSGSGYAEIPLSGFGGAGGLPAVADYDGDGKVDLALYEKTTGNWRLRLSSAGYDIVPYRGYGGEGWMPVVGDYDGDGKADLVLYNTATATWQFRLSGAEYRLFTTTF